MISTIRFLVLKIVRRDRAVAGAQIDSEAEARAHLLIRWIAALFQLDLRGSNAWQALFACLQDARKFHGVGLPAFVEQSAREWADRR